MMYQLSVRCMHLLTVFTAYLCRTTSSKSRLRSVPPECISITSNISKHTKCCSAQVPVSRIGSQSGTHPPCSGVCTAVSFTAFKYKVFMYSNYIAIDVRIINYRISKCKMLLFIRLRPISYQFYSFDVSATHTRFRPLSLAL